MQQPHNHISALNLTSIIIPRFIPQNFVIAVCNVLAIPCKVCNGIGLAVCPQITLGIMPVVCVVCAAKPPLPAIGGFTELVQSNNITFDGFTVPNQTQQTN